MVNDNIKILMDANCNMHYSAFYVDGIRKLFGKKYKFDFKNFESLKNQKRCFLFIVIINDKKYNIAIDFHDPRDIDTDVLKWCDVYAKINFHAEISSELLLKSLQNDADEFNKHFSKIISIPPSFGTRVFNLFETLKHIFFILKNQDLKLIIKSKKLILDNVRMYIKRVPLSYYFRSQSKEGYVFLMASIWHKSTSFVNYARANFIGACKQNPKINFEGGLVDIGYECDYIDNLENVSTGKKKMKLTEYISKTQTSNFVFNTPSVEYCHGWKLSEYLCLGKAIISTTLSNELPFPLEHGKNIHFVDQNIQSITDAVDYFIDNQEYVKKLEFGAFQYWKDYCTPEKVIEQVLFKVNPALLKY